MSLAAAPEESAEEAGLRYATDDRPGITRRRAGRGFSYRAPDGGRIADAATLARIRALAIPPAWTGVWISPDPRGHLQATGRDARGRKQYRYHPRWRTVRDETKYGRLLEFGRALPTIRRRVDRDLRRRGLPRERVIAAVVRLLETTSLRVGNEEYARDNGSYGLTTLRNRHAKVGATVVRLRFKGKHGKVHEATVSDARLARIVGRLQDLPGQELFQYVDEEGELRDVGSEEVNAYLREITGADFTAKDFRTWAGTVLAAWALRAFEQFDSEAQARHNIVEAIEEVSKRLGNTPAVSRASYVHPAVIDAYLDGQLVREARRAAEADLRDRLPSLEPEEAAVISLLRGTLVEVERGDGAAPRRRSQAASKRSKARR
jgi:DNA topoisomerase-1